MKVPPLTAAIRENPSGIPLHDLKNRNNTSKTINRVDEWGITISPNTVHVELDFIDGIDCWAIQKVVIDIERNSMSNKINCIGFKLKLLDYFREGNWFQIHTLYHILDCVPSYVF